MAPREMEFFSFLGRFRCLQAWAKKPQASQAQGFATQRRLNTSIPSHEAPSSIERANTLLRVGEECQTEPELRRLIDKKPNFICYDGFEPSGRMHVAQGLFKAINVNYCVDAGGEFVFWIADWFALMNDKMGGELQRIRLVGKYFVEVWKACGMKMESVTFKWASEEINKNPKEYWKGVLDIAKRNSLSRITKCCQIMGRKEGNLSAAQILYPLMQCSDIFFLKADVCQLGLDQRKVNMLARDYCDQIGRKLKPIILSHHMMRGLKEIREEDGSLKKMSKSDPDSAIFMEDGADEVSRKISAAYCPSGDDIDSNPCLDYIQNIVFARQSSFLEFDSFEEVYRSFRDGSLSESRLKQELARLLNLYIEPVRKHFVENENAKNILSMVRKGVEVSTGECVPRAEATISPHVIAWIYPALELRLLEIIKIVGTLNAHIANGAKATVVFADWSADAVNCAYVRREKDVDTLLAYTSNCLRSYGLHESVSIVKQSSMILSDADAYWLKVIEIGRKVSVSSIEDKWGTKGLPLAGTVIAALMHVTDVAITGATDVVSCSRPMHAACPSGEFSRFAAEFLSETNAVDIGLIALDSVDVTMLCDDSPEVMKKKIMKLYAPITETQSNALVDLTKDILDVYTDSSIAIAGSEAAAPRSYRDIDSVRRDYSDGSLHPGDLKKSVTQFLVEKTSASRSAFTNSIEGDAKLKTSLKALRKK